MEDLIQFVRSLDPWLVYAVVFSIAYIENIFPPSPSDIIVVFGGSLVGIGRVGFVETVLATTAGSTLGFLTMFKIGEWFGASILEKGRLKFIPAAGVKKVDEWFRRYGYGIIVANRFLAGTRAVVSFVGGMAHMKLVPTTVLCLISALAWNTLLVGGGYLLGQNWEHIGFYLTTYSQIVTGIVCVVAAILIAGYFARRNGRRRGR